MNFRGFKIFSVPYLEPDRACTCGGKLHAVSNGFLSMAIYCHDCKSVYIIKMIKLPKKKVTKEFLAQCKKEVEMKNKKDE